MNAGQGAGVVFDIETGPENRRAKELMPDFDPEEVKMGNLKDESKRAEKLQEARENHEKNWMDKSALRPETGRVVAIGYYHPDKGYILNSIKNMRDEADLISDFWSRLNEFHQATGKPFLGFNCAGFDLPYLIIRSRILGITVPAGIFKGRYPDSNRFIDLRNDWLCGRNWQEVKSSLDYVAKAFGLSGKNGNGKDFAELMDRDEMGALGYLFNDIRLTKEIAEKMGYNFEPTTSTWDEWSKKYLESKKPVQEAAF